MSFTTKVRYGLESILARLGLALIPRLPRCAVVALARFFGYAAWLLAFSLRRVARTNLDFAFGDEYTPQEKNWIARQSFVSFALVLLDLFWFTRDAEARIAKWVDDEGVYDDRFLAGGLVFLTGHLGNWELLGRTVSLHARPMSSVAAPIDNPWIQHRLEELRRNTGQIIIPKEGAYRKLIRTLKEGGHPAFLLDQNTKPSRGGVFVPFFGLSVAASGAVAMLAMRQRCGMVFIFCIPQPDGRYRVDPVEYLDLDVSGMEKDQAVETLTAAIMEVYERWIRRYPQHWLWMYKRWKYIAPDHDANQYLYYSKPLWRKDRIAVGLDVDQ